MSIDEVLGKCRKVSEASQICDIAFPSRVDQLGSRGREQDERALDIRSSGNLGRAVVHFEILEHVPPNLAG